MRYLKGTIDLVIYCGRDHDYRLYEYTDSSWEGSATDNKNTSDGCYGLGSTMISWFSWKKYNVSLSTTEAEYIATCYVSYQVIWIQKLMSGLFDLELDTTVILYDNQSCIKMTKNPLFHDKSKHIEIQYFKIWDMVQQGYINLQYVSTNEQFVDVLTNPLYRVKFEYFCDKIGVVRKDLPQKGEQ